MQKRLLVEASNLLPDFNDDLLLNFRKNKINQIEEYLNSLFLESVKLFGGRLHYVGYSELTPEERLEYIKTNPILRKKVDINKSSFKLLRFNFEFEGELFPLHVATPYLENGAVYLGGTQYFPLFPIVERGGVHRTSNSIIIKVMRAPLTFRRSESYTIETTNGKVFREIVVTVKIHQRRRGRGGKRTDRTPLLLYHLVTMSFDKTMAYYGFQPNEIAIVTDAPEVKGMSYVKIKEDIFLRIHDGAFNDLHKRRVIASFLMCLSEYTKFCLRDLVAVHPVYYKTVLGKYTYPSNTNGQLLFDNAEKHLETTKLLLDPPAQYQLSTIGIEVKDIYDLLQCVFYNIDKWIIGYDPTDLYTKKIGALDQIMASLVSTINNRQFPIINSKNQGLTSETVKRFVTQASQYENWMMGNSTFRANPSMCNDNWLFSIGSKRFRSLENAETKSNMNRSHGKNTPVSLLKAHPSNLVVESGCSIPPSSPIVTGEINPYLQINENGDIVKPDWANDIEDIFD